MITLVAQFGAPQDVTSPGLDGKVFRFSFSAIEAEHIGTPRQSLQTMTGRISVEISDSVIAVWRLSATELIKALFQVAKEHLASVLQKSGKVIGDIKITINSSTHSGPCPFDVGLIEEPEGAVVKVEVSRQIGFV